VLVIAGANYEWKKEELRMLDSFIRSGKPALFMVDAASPVEGFNDLLEPFGVGFNSDYIVLRQDDPRAQLLGRNIALVSELDTAHPVTREFSAEGGVVFPLANSRSLEIDLENKLGMSIDELAKTAEIMQRVKNVKTKEDLKGISAERFESGTFTTIALIQGELKDGAEVASTGDKKDNVTDVKEDMDVGSKSIRVGVVGSAQLASNYGAQQKQNIDLFMNLINYLLRDETFISIRPKSALKTSLSLSSGGSSVALAFITWIYPLLFLAGGLFFWIRRRRA